MDDNVAQRTVKREALLALVQALEVGDLADIAEITITSGYVTVITLPHTKVLDSNGNMPTTRTVFHVRA